MRKNKRFLTFYIFTLLLVVFPKQTTFADETATRSNLTEVTSAGFTSFFTENLGSKDKTISAECELILNLPLVERLPGRTLTELEKTQLAEVLKQLRISLEEDHSPAMIKYQFARCRKMFYVLLEAPGLTPKDVNRTFEQIDSMVSWLSNELKMRLPAKHAEIDQLAETATKGWKSICMYRFIAALKEPLSENQVVEIKSKLELSLNRDETSLGPQEIFTEASGILFGNAERIKVDLTNMKACVGISEDDLKLLEAEATSQRLQKFKKPDNVTDAEWRWLVGSSLHKSISGQRSTALAHYESILKKREKMHSFLLPIILLSEVKSIDSRVLDSLTNDTFSRAAIKNHQSFVIRMPPSKGLVSPLVLCSMEFEGIKKFLIKAKGVTPDFQPSGVPLDPANFFMRRSAGTFVVQSPLQGFQKVYDMEKAEEKPLIGTSTFQVAAILGFLKTIDKGVKEIECTRIGESSIGYIGIDGSRCVLSIDSAKQGSMTIFRYIADEDIIVPMKKTGNDGNDGGVEHLKNRKMQLTMATIHCDEVEGVHLHDILVIEKDGGVSYKFILSKDDEILSDAAVKQFETQSKRYMEILYEHWRDIDGLQKNKEVMNYIEHQHEQLFKERIKEPIMEIFVLGHHIHLLMLANKTKEFLKASDTLLHISHQSRLYTFAEGYFLQAFLQAERLGLEEIADISFKTWVKALGKRRFTDGELRHYLKELSGFTKENPKSRLFEALKKEIILREESSKREVAPKHSAEEDE